MHGTWRFGLLALIILLLVQIDAEDADTNMEDPDGNAEIIEDSFEEDHQTLSHALLLKMHHKMDANGDGSLSMRELMDYSVEMRTTLSRVGLEGLLESLDSDGNRKVSWVELNDKNPDQENSDHYDPVLEEKKFEAADRNGDGQLNLLELSVFFSPKVDDAVLTAHVSHVLETRDMDGDGQLNPVEFAPPRIDAEADPEEEHAALQQALESYWSDPSSVQGDEDFVLADQDKDGMLDLHELKAYESGHLGVERAMRALFDLADKNRDDLITVDELAAVSGRLEGSEAHDHILAWAEHAEL